MKISMLVVSLLFTLSSELWAEDLVTFQNGQLADADDVNGNFNLLDDRWDALYGGSQTVNLRFDESDFNAAGYIFSEIVSVSCLSNEVLVGSALTCDTDGFDSSTTNWGGGPFKEYYFGKAVIAYCVGWSAVLDNSKYGPPARIEALCLEDIAAPSPPPLPAPLSSNSQELDEAEIAVEMIKAQMQEEIAKKTAILSEQLAGRR